jgi:hypothetical protein
MKRLAALRRWVWLIACLAIVPALALADEPVPDESTTVYLPLVVTAPRVTPIEFASELDEFGVPVNPRAEFAHGIDELYASVVISGAQGSHWSVEWEVPGAAEPIRLDCDPNNPNEQCPISVPEIRISPFLYYPDGEPLPPGPYTTRFYLDGVLYQEATAVIR